MNFSSFRIQSSFYKYISGLLIFCLILSQTIHVSFFDRVEASPEKYRDIVSIFVDRETYSQTEDDVKKYANNIETYLGGTRVSIFVVGSDISPESIASRNEKLYYEGDDSSEVSRLVGTILIGNLSVPMVYDGIEVFPSIYPYVDFVDKQFAWNSRSLRYEYLPQANRQVVEPEIWHGVMNPSLGRQWSASSDIGKIRDFLKKTDDFYAGKGKFAPRTTPPRVFYYDGFYESKSVNIKNLFQYGLMIKNVENLAYKRFTKYLLQDINTAIAQYDATTDGETKQLLASLGIPPGNDGLDPETIKMMPDIQSRLPIQSLLKNFKSIINEKTLSDAYLFVRNAGRYSSGSSVRVDLAPISMTLADEVAQSTLKEANTALMNSIDAAIVASGIARNIPIFDGLQTSYGAPISVAGENLKSYSGFYLGQLAQSVNTAQMCSLTRGSNNYVGTFGRSELVEANVGYDVTSAEGQLEKLRIDTEELVKLKRNNAYACFESSGTPKLESYWGGNSILRVVNSSNPTGALNESPGNTRIKGMSQSIVSLGGMKETTRLPPATISDCISDRYLYAIRSPEIIQVEVNRRLSESQYCSVGNPSEWNTSAGICGESIGNRKPRYSCISQNEMLPTVPSIADSLVRFTNTPCLAGSVYLNGRAIQSSNKTCINRYTGSSRGSNISADGTEGEYLEDETTYENVNFHTISSLLRHVSPTDEEIAIATNNGATPSLGVDMIRYLEFFTPKGNIARVEYPNFFTLSGSDITGLRSSLRSLSQQTWNTIIAQENAKTLSPKEERARIFLMNGNPGISVLDWNNYISDDLLLKILQSKNWLNPDVTLKYKQSIETGLSYSHEYPKGDVTKTPPKIPTLSDSYEIAYLGLTSFFPESQSNTEAETIMNDYATKFSGIRALNYSEEVDYTNNPYKSASECGPPEGVDLFQWPQAIMCWVQNLSLPRISAGSCGPGTIGISAASQFVSPPNGILSSIQQIRDFYAGGTLTYSIPRTTLSFGETVTLQYQYQKNLTPLTLPDGSSVSIISVSGSIDGKALSTQELENYIQISSKTVPLSEAPARFILSTKNKKANIDIVAELSLKFPDGSTSLVRSAPLNIRISDQYLDIVPRGGTLLDVTDTGSLVLDFQIRDHSGAVFDPIFPLQMSIMDDITQTTIASGITINSSSYTLPSIFSKKVGVYKLSVTDAIGRMGELTVAVRSGKLTRAELKPISSVILKGSDTYATLDLLDALSNPISPDLHTIDIETENGYIIAPDGTKKQNYRVDLMESSLNMRIGGFDVGQIRVRVKVDSVLMGTYTIDVVPRAEMRLIRSSEPMVGGNNQMMNLRIVDENGKTLSGFSSVVSLILPKDAGLFADDLIQIRNGISEPFEYVPGVRSGVHMLEAQIPGIGSIKNIPFSLAPGIPLYINHIESNGNIVFTVRDRYGNQVQSSLSGTIQKNNEPVQNISFISGAYLTPQKTGFYIVRSPGLIQSQIRYTDDVGQHAINGIPYYATYVQGTREQFDFLPDYNARYTVLAGGSFLREGEDILYNTTPGLSQSLAVSTLLDDTDTREHLISLSPNGGLSLGTSENTSIDLSVSMERGYPIVGALDTVSHKTIMRTLYKMEGARLTLCSADDCGKQLSPRSLVLETDAQSPYRSVIEDKTIRLYSSNTRQIEIRQDGSLDLAAGIEVVPNIALSEQALALDLKLGGQKIATIYYVMDGVGTIQRLGDIFSGTVNTPVIDANIQVRGELFPVRTYSSTELGYRVLGDVGNSQNTTKNGPTSIDSLADLQDLPGVGWQGSNQMMLAYSAGDTVGQATRFFHTFTFINLGDPVAHVDKKAPGTEIDGIDRSIGTQITSSNGSRVSQFAHRDMNADGYEDLVVSYVDGYLELFENRVGKFRSEGRIAYIPDLISRGFSLGDFHKDGYADIVGVNASGSFVILENDARHFQKMTPLLSRSGEVLPSSVSQFRVRDMDVDGRDDIVYLTDFGELGILYGTEIQGVFEKKILDQTLGVTLVNTEQSIGGAFFGDNIPQKLAKTLGVSPTNYTGTLDETMLQTEVFYPYVYPRGLSPSQSINISDQNNPLSGSSISTTFMSSPEASSEGTQTDLYVRSEYAPAYGVTVSRTFKNLSHPTLRSGDRVLIDIALTNTSGVPIKNVSYLEKVPAIFSHKNTSRYSLVLDDLKVDRDFESIPDGEYDIVFAGKDIPAGKTLHILYEVESLPATYGELLVGNFEGGESGDDTYGDVGFKNSTTCGADMLLWRSGPESRSYTRGSRSFTNPQIPENIANKLKDADRDGVPDSITSASSEDLNASYRSTLTQGETSDTSSLVRVRTNGAGVSVDVGFDSSTMSEIDSVLNSLVSGLNCGFGGGGCLSFPINWAPLAPGSAPSVFGFPVFPLTPNTGYPLFSFPTTKYTSHGPIPVPNLPPGKGGIFGYGAPFFSQVRVYVTPTLTLGMGTAVCFGPGFATGWLPPPGLSPLVPGGNCIVVARSMPVCKADGSRADGDVSGFSGLGTLTNSWNSQSCSLTAKTSSSVQDTSLTRDIISYLKDPKTRDLNALYGSLSKRGARTKDLGTLVRIGGSESSSNTQVGIEIDNAKPISLGNIIKVKNKRISAFPDFLMNWITRQTDEITNALFTPPNLTIIPPTTLGQHATIDSSMSGFLQQFSAESVRQGYADFQKKTGDAYNSADVTKSLNSTIKSKSDLSASFAEKQRALIEENKGVLNSAQGGINAIRAGYTFIGKLPFISIQEKTILLNIPWILPQELDRYSRSLKAYSQELNQTLDEWCRGKTPQECADGKSRIQTSAFMSSLNANLKRIEEYRNFPIKLQKYVTWKQRYMTQILCNIDVVQKITGGWLKDNGIRFRKWAELYVLLRAIADSWQPVLDILADTNASCGVCRNERYNSQYWKFKLLSMIIPSIPVIRFPRWPNIVLNLSDIRLGISLTVPNFQPRLSPIRLPDLPNLNLPNTPTLALSLPALPLLPSIPSLPDLPDLPSFPTIHLPNLPPPPKVPKLLGSISSVLSILKLVGKLYCYYQNTVLVPEWQAGDVIAQRTERQGTLSFDFLNINFPQLTLPTVRDITVSSHVNFQLRSDFIAEFAKSAVKPLNEFSTDLTQILPKKIIDDINIKSPIENVNIKVQSYHAEDPLIGRVKDFIQQQERDSSIALDTDSFIPYFLSELRAGGLHVMAQDLALSLKGAQSDQEKLTNELLEFNDTRFAHLRNYVNAQFSETAELQNIVDTLQSTDLGDIVADFQYVSDTNRKSQSYLHKYNVLIAGTMDDTHDVNAVDGTTLTSAATRLQKRMGQVADIVSPILTENSSIAEGYAPSFRGIYIITSGGEQTQLFDYSQYLIGDEAVEKVDIDRDGDADYIYHMNGVVYIKYSTLSEPEKIIDTSIRVIRGDDHPEPRTPNYFHENIITPNRLSLGFSPSQMDEREWRLEFYDRYSEDAMIQLGTNDEVKTPKNVIDLIAQDVSEAPESFPVSRAIERVSQKTGFTLSSPRITFFTGSVSFVLNAGKTIYTGKERVSILYGTGDALLQERVLEPFTGYRFSETYTIKKTKGNLYYIETSGIQENYLYTDDLIGMPLVPSSQVLSRDGYIDIMDIPRKKLLRIKKNAFYAFKNIGTPNDQYTFEIDYQNGFYSARLSNLDVPYAHRTASILLAPQAFADRSAPDIDLSDIVRIPVYGSKIIPLKDIITESTIYQARIDTDIDQDTSGDSIPDNDFVTSASGVQISSSSLQFGPFDTIGRYMMKLRVTDEENNTTDHLFQLQIYSPLPMIQSMSLSGTLQGKLDESIDTEPVHIFRVRRGSEIFQIHDTPLVTGSGGIFSTGSLTSSSGATLRIGSTRIFLSENGLFRDVPDPYRIRIVPASIESPMKIELIDANQMPVYSTFFTLGTSIPLIDINTTTSNITQFVGIRSLESYRYVPATSSDPFLAGGGYIVDKNYLPVAAISRDGNLYVLQANIDIKYKNINDKMALTLVQNTTPIAEIFYSVDFFSTLK